ncbi:MAG: type VI secretion system baseplate subunit TssG [Alphaproteobacteria bacterium]|nr:type VI secretion system baseplate subunit TssG [Alphaproteobacteria bacterium]
MASITWRENPPVKEALIKHVYEFDFDQAIQVLETLDPESTPLGEGDDPHKEAIRIKSRVSFAVPSTELDSIQETSDQKPILWINFLSIAGIVGPLPTPYTETVIERTRIKDTAFRDFLDIFNHRFASLWHRFRKKNIPGLLQKSPEKSPIGKTVLELSGISSIPLLNESKLDPSILLTYRDLLWKRSHSSAGLIRIIRSYFKVPAVLEQFQGRWVKARPFEFSVIGSKEGQFNVLGSNLIIGKMSWDQVASATIAIGPLNWDQYCSFLPIHSLNKKPHESHLPVLERLTYFYSGLDVQFFARFILNRFEIRSSRLDGNFALGFNTWLKCDKIPSENPFVKISLSEPHR